MTTENKNNTYSVIRSDQSGVWVGKVVERQVLPNARSVVKLADAYKVHAWSNTAATSGLAIQGPGEGSRICEPVEVAEVGDVCEVLQCTAQAVKRLKAIDPWRF